MNYPLIPYNLLFIDSRYPKRGEKAYNAPSYSLKDYPYYLIYSYYVREVDRAKKMRIISDESEEME